MHHVRGALDAALAGEAQGRPVSAQIAERDRLGVLHQIAADARKADAPSRQGLANAGKRGQRHDARQHRRAVESRLANIEARLQRQSGGIDVDGALRLQRAARYIVEDAQAGERRAGVGRGQLEAVVVILGRHRELEVAGAAGGAVGGDRTPNLAVGEQHCAHQVEAALRHQPDAIDLERDLQTRPGLIGALRFSIEDRLEIEAGAFDRDGELALALPLHHRPHIGAAALDALEVDLLDATVGAERQLGVSLDGTGPQAEGLDLGQAIALHGQRQMRRPLGERLLLPAELRRGHVGAGEIGGNLDSGRLAARLQ